MSETAAKPKSVTITGTVQSWNLGDTPATAEEYIVVNTNHASARQLTKPYLFSAQDGEGEQRANKKPRVRHMKNVITGFNFTPTVWYAGVRPDHKVTRKDGKVEIEISPELPLPLTDASHRRTSLEEIRLSGSNLGRKVDNLPITLIIHLDPTKTKRNFINLQESAKVDTGQLLTMKIANGGLKKAQQEHYNNALEIAKTLHTTSSSHLYRLVKFDTQSGGSLPFKSIAQPGKSDLATSLYGTALIVEDYKKDAEWGASMILTAYETLLKDAPEVLKKGLVLAPEPDGTIGGTTMLVGLGNMLAARMKVLEREFPSEADDKWFVKCVKTVFAGEEVGGSFSAQRKRDLMNQFIEEYFRPLIEDEDSVVGAHEGIPIFLCLLFGTSAFNVTKIAKPKGKRGRKPKATATPETEVALKEPEVVTQEVSSEKVAQSDTDPEWVEDDDDLAEEEAPPWIDDESDDEDPFGTPELDKNR